MCSERPLVVVCGDWCAGGGTVDRALASGAAAAAYAQLQRDQNSVFLFLISMVSVLRLVVFPWWIRSHRRSS